MQLLSETSDQRHKGHEAALHEIVEALRAPRKDGEQLCALCLRRSQSVEREVRAFFAEYVNDAQARSGWRCSQGFCGDHTRLLATIGDSLAIAILYADLADLTRERWRKADSHSSRQMFSARLRRGRIAAAPASCLACDMAHAADERNAAALAQALAHDDEELWQAMEAGGGLCVAHTDQVSSLAAPAAAARLRQSEERRLAVLQSELEEIIRKNDYRFRGETWGAERDAWLRAIQKLKRPGP